MEGEICFGGAEAEFAGISQFGRADMDNCAPLLPHLDACSPELSPGWKQHICFPNLCCFQWGNRHQPTRTLKMPAHAASTFAFLCKQQNSKKLFYTGNRSVALGSKEHCMKWGQYSSPTTVFLTHLPLLDIQEFYFKPICSEVS